MVAITVNTSNATHCYQMAESFRSRGIKVIMGGPHATLLPEEVKKNCDYIIIGEGEIIWPEFLEDFYEGRAKKEYTCEEVPSLKYIPIARRDLIHERCFIKGAVISSRGVYV